jgi:co-chaperonin GroES (HSP10)
MKIRPLHDRVLIRRVRAEEKTLGGIIIPDTAQEKPMEGEVIAVGPGARNEQGLIVELEVKVRIPMHRGHLLRFDRGQATDLMAVTVPI